MWWDQLFASDEDFTGKWEHDEARRKMELAKLLASPEATPDVDTSRMDAEYLPIYGEVLAELGKSRKGDEAAFRVHQVMQGTSHPFSPFYGAEPEDAWTTLKMRSRAIKELGGDPRPKASEVDSESGVPHHKWDEVVARKEAIERAVKESMTPGMLAEELSKIMEQPMGGPELPWFAKEMPSGPRQFPNEMLPELLKQERLPSGELALVYPGKGVIGIINENAEPGRIDIEFPRFTNYR